LASTSNNGVPTSEFTIVADKFSIAPVQTDNTANDGSPFFHRTTATTINGVSVPAGTYMKAAYIHDATITNAKIADLAVDNAKIANLSASKLTAGSISVGQHIQSSGFVSGTSGWRINGDGTAEFANAIVRGTVYANAGSFTGSIYASSGAIGGVNINGGGLNAGGFTGYAWPTSGQNGFHLGPGGLAMGNPDNGKYFNVTADGNVFAPGLSIVGGAATFSGSLSAATGTFKGSLQAASGSFSGTLTADAINAVSTINIADNAVSVVVSAGGTGSEVATTINVPQGQTWKVVVIGFVSSSPEFEYGTSAGNPTTRPPLATIGVNGASSFLSPIRVRDVLTSSNETGDGYSHYWVYQSSSVSNVLTLTQGTHTLSVTGPSSTFKAIVALGAKK
jgi:hypothetical protein